jgi:hypothetical protein
MGSAACGSCEADAEKSREEAEEDVKEDADESDESEDNESDEAEEEDETGEPPEITGKADGGDWSRVAVRTDVLAAAAARTPPAALVLG